MLCPIGSDGHVMGSVTQYLGQSFQINQFKTDLNWFVQNPVREALSLECQHLTLEQFVYHFFGSITSGIFWDGIR